MTDHKFTDEEVIKALECCKTDGGNCVSCIYFYRCVDNVCIPYLTRDALDLINRQKAEIERFVEVDKTYSEIRAEAIKEFAERLKERAYTSSDWPHGEHPQVVELEDINEIVEELTEKGDNNGQKEN